MENCTWIHKELPEIIDIPIVQAIFALLYGTIWICGVFGNSCVVYCGVVRRISFSVRIIFILSLAFSDLFICLVPLPITAVMAFTRRFVFPTFFCSWIGFLQATAVFVGSFTLITIAIDRYFMICHPTKEILTYKRAILSIILIWVLAALSALPLAVYTVIIPNAVFENTTYCGPFCAERWPGTPDASGTTVYQRFYGVFALFAQFALPLILCSICYVCISKTLKNQITARKEMQNMLPEAEERMIQRRKKTNFMMVLMVASFALSWLPLSFGNTVRDFGLNFIPVDLFTVIFTSCHCLAMTMVVWNPIIYGWFNQPFRKVVVNVLTSVRRRF